MLLRRQGGLTFAELRDRTGTLQLFVDTHVIGADEHHRFDHLDRGDIVGAEGTVMTTRRGELSVKVTAFQLLTKSLRPLPAKWEGLTDVDTRFRQRYVDLVVNDKTRHIFDIRRKAISSIREYLHEHGFYEVETPVLQNEQGGATARPFITHHNALDINLYLRIALELHLKRLIVGGMERVYEMAKVFRNEGIDTRHNPEFTMLEAYQAYGDYHEMMDLTEALVVNAAGAARDGNTVITLDGRQLDLGKPWRRATMVELIKEKVGVDINPAMPVEQARAVLDGLGMGYSNEWGSGKLTDEVYDQKVEETLFEPTFVLDHPREVSPLARAHRDDPTLTERFEVVINGRELANAYSELNDPIDQLERFQAEARAKAAGDLEAGDVDEDFVRALEYGMPPTGGMGIGIDRLIMLLAEVDNIREVILFPTLRPEGGRKGPPGPGPKTAMPPEHAALLAAAAAGTTDGKAKEGKAATEAEARAAAPSKAATPGRPGPVVLMAWLTALGGLLSLIPLIPWVHTRLEPFAESFGPLWFRVTGHVVSVVLGLALLYLSRQLLLQKQLAWRVSFGLFALLAIAHLVKGPHPGAAVYSAAMVVLLLATRPYFRAKPDPPSLWSLVRFIPSYLAFVFVFGFGALLIERNDTDPDFTLGGMTATVLKGLVGIDGDYTYGRRFFAEFFPAAMLTLGIVGLVVILVLLFRPLVARQEHTETDWDRARQLVHTYGWDTLAYFSLRDDKSFFFSSDGRAMIAYTYLGGYGLASGDPIGAPESIPLVLDEFLAFCRERAWKPAFLAVRESDLPLYQRRGLHHLYLGDEAIIHCDRFTLEGPEMKGVRQAVARVGKRYRFEMSRECDIRRELLDACNEISARWRGKKPERGFTMSLSQDLTGESTEFLICMAIDENGRPGGFLRIVPAYGADFGYTLDLMRHDPDAPNGMTEFLIANSALALKDRGIGRLSMNFAAWGRLFDPDVHYGPGMRAAKWFVNLLNPFFQIKSLRDFNAKFSPEWLPRVICYHRSGDLARVAVLYAGIEGFLSVPGLGNLLVPKATGGVPSPDTVVTPAA